MIQNHGKPFILWASARTASSQFFFKYLEKNNCKVMHKTHEPLNVQKKLLGGGILEFINKKYSFKCMVNTSRVLKLELDRLQQAIPTIDYTHIILYRKDLYARQRSFMFSKYNDVWKKEDLTKPRDSSWYYFKKEDIPSLVDQAIRWETECLNMYVKCIKRLKAYDIPYQVVEFNDAIQYIDKDTSQGTKQYYDKMFQSEELKKSLKNLIINHEFYSMI